MGRFVDRGIGVVPALRQGIAVMEVAERNWFVERGFHFHACVSHGEYACSWSVCSIQRGLEDTSFHCRECIIVARNLDSMQVARLAELKEAQQTNKRQHRKRLAGRPTNAVVLGKRKVI